LTVFTVLLDAVFDSVLDIFWLVGVSRVVRRDWHDPCGQQVVELVERVVGAVTDHPDRLFDSPVPKYWALLKSNWSALSAVKQPVSGVARTDRWWVCH